MADRLHSAAIHLLRRLRVEDEALGISAPRLSVLSVLVFAGPKRIGELARIEQVEPPTMTRLVDGLVRDGLAVRDADPDDARAVRVLATPTGARTLRRGRARRVETLSRSLAALSPTELAALSEGVEMLELILRDR
ncbi:MAG: MarR family transcriptional regulator [Actinomycetota bacterium]|nr:MarR family transcriptional regulator [Actinomycetota bacterium]